ELAQAYDYDLIVLDVLIPKLDGISLCRELRSSGCQMPILLLAVTPSPSASATSTVTTNQT
ncbi:response regulator, partial [Microcoleus sp. CAWBG27]|uniref:response regulator n=1 Tax=Microcoleus sp. CAWBG27 TaxID=2841645 RepID=UPI00345B7FEF